MHMYGVRGHRNRKVFENGMYVQGVVINYKHTHSMEEDKIQRIVHSTEATPICTWQNA